MDSAYTEPVTIPCPAGRRPCMHFYCPDAAADGAIWCVKHHRSFETPTRVRVDATAYTEPVTIPCPAGRRPCMHPHCPEAANDGAIWCGEHDRFRKAGVFAVERRVRAR